MQSEEHKRSTFRIDWTINPSHIIAVGGIIIAIFSFVYSVRSDLQTTNENLGRLALEFKNKNELQDIEMKQIRDSTTVWRAEEAAYRSEMRSAVGELTKVLTDLRISTAKTAK